MGDWYAIMREDGRSITIGRDRRKLRITGSSQDERRKLAYACLTLLNGELAQLLKREMFISMRAHLVPLETTNRVIEDVLRKLSL